MYLGLESAKAVKKSVKWDGVMLPEELTFFLQKSE